HSDLRARLAPPFPRGGMKQAVTPDQKDSRQGVAILGSTGSIGMSTLDVLARHPDRFVVVALTANSQVDRLYEQCVRFRPRLAAMLDPSAARELERRLRASHVPTEVLGGPQGLVAAA